jgi:hypothetical protein
MGNEWEGYRAKTDKAAVRATNEEVDRRHARWRREREAGRMRRRAPGDRGLLGRLFASLGRALGRR